jgi:hypothetical protein
MRKTNTVLMISLALALLASVTMNQINTAFAQTKEPVGVVVDYVPDVSITIMDKEGNQSTFELTPSLKILPPGQEKTLAVGSFVTVIAPATLDKGKQKAVGIVIHPKVPDGWKVATKTPPLETSTAQDKFTPTGTLATETPTPFETPTVVGTLTETETATPTAPGAATDKSTPTTPDLTNTSFIEWLRTLFRQVLSSQ